VPVVWAVHVGERDAPAIVRWLDRPGASLALSDLLRDPADRERALPAVALMLVRGASAIAAPGDDVQVALGDEILVAGRGEARSRLRGTLHRDPTRDYVLSGRYTSSGWLWSKLLGSRRRSGVQRQGGGRR
jgi:voltage-gated potassium channel